MAVVGVVALLVVGAAVVSTFVLGIGQDQQAAVGASVGGAQDAGGLERNVERGYLPQVTDITYEGVVREHYFDVGQTDCRERFCPSVGTAVAEDPLSGDTERYVAVGLHSGIESFERPPVDVVVVVDTSGSMDSSIAAYAADGERPGETTRKMAAARQATLAMVDELRPGDRVSVVAYDDSARVVQSVTRVGELDREDLERRVRGMRADGGTNLAAGMDVARGQLDDYADPTDDREQRVIYVTDAMPNVNAGQAGLASRMESHADSGVHTTFVGVGVDFNSRLVETIGTVRGANYYTVESASRFEERLSDGFGYMITPLAYDLRVEVTAPGHAVTRAYGVPSEERRSRDSLIEVQTVFPSRSENGASQGGVILLGLERTASDAGPVEVTASYETPGGERRSVTRTATPKGPAERYTSADVRKAVLLAQYTDLLRNWAAYERARVGGDSPSVDEGISPSPVDGRWEQYPHELVVSPAYRERLRAFGAHFDAETADLAANFTTERRILETLSAAAGPDEDGRPDADKRPPSLDSAVDPARPPDRAVDAGIGGA